MAASLNTMLILSICPLLSVSEELQPQNLTAQPGGDVTLSCQAPNNVAIAAVEWSRPDLEKYVYLMSDGHVEKAYQHPSYINRVQLKDDEMKNGDLSLVLKKVNSKDDGIYECRYVGERGGRRKRSAIGGDPISIVQINVKGPGDGDQEAGGQRSGHLGVILPVSLIVAAAGFAVVGL